MRCRKYCMYKDDPDTLGVKCGFKDGVFTKDNYSCTILVGLRDEKAEVYNNDSRAYILPIPYSIDYEITGENEFVLLEHYKHRGRTNIALMFSDEGYKPLTHELAMAMFEFKMKDILCPPTK